MYQCLQKLLNSGEISEKVYKEIYDEYTKTGDPESILKSTEQKINSTKQEKSKHAYSFGKYNELKTWLDDFATPDEKKEAITDLITLRKGMPSSKANVEITKEVILGDSLRPVMDELPAFKTKIGMNKKALDNISSALFKSDIPLTPEITRAAEGFRSSFDKINQQLIDAGITPIANNINEIVRTPVQILNFSEKEFIDKVSPLVTNQADDISNVYRAAVQGDEISTLRFRSAEAKNQYESLLGTNSLESLVGYIERSAAQLAQVKILGHNPKLTLEKLIKDIDPADTAFINKTSKMLDFATGFERINRDPNMLATGLSTLRPVGTASMLGSAAVMALLDQATITTTSQMMGIPIMTQLRSTIRMLAKENRYEMAQLGFQLDSIMNQISQTSRFNPHASTNDLMNKIATGVLRYSGLTFLTDVHRLAFKNSALVTFQDHSKYSFQQLASVNPKLQKKFTHYGIDSTEWDIARKSTTPEALFLDPTNLPDDVRAKFMRMINEETNYAVIQPGARSSWYTSIGGTERGTVAGETARHLTQFKSSLVEILFRHVYRVGREDGIKNKMQFGTYHFISTILVGGLIYEIKQLLEGKEPIDPTKNPLEYVGYAMRMAGTVPVITDQLIPYLIDPTEYEKMKTPTEIAFGVVTPPTLSKVLGIGKDSFDSIMSAAGGDEDKAMRNLSQSVKGLLKMVPGNNIWYFKELFNTYLVDTMEKIIDPEAYNRRIRKEKKEMRKLDQDFLF